MWGGRADPLVSLAAHHAADVGQLLTGRVAPRAGTAPLLVERVGSGIGVEGTHGVDGIGAVRDSWPAETFPVVCACGFLSRLVGLTRVRRRGPDVGLLFAGCAGVHCLGMRVPLCVVGLGHARLAGGLCGPDALVVPVTRVVTHARPWTFPALPGACHVLEAECDGPASCLRAGDELLVRLGAGEGRRAAGRRLPYGDGPR